MAGSGGLERPQDGGKEDDERKEGLRNAARKSRVQGGLRTAGEPSPRTWAWGVDEAWAGQVGRGAGSASFGTCASQLAGRRKEWHFLKVEP